MFVHGASVHGAFVRGAFVRGAFCPWVFRPAFREAISLCSGGTGAHQFCNCVLVNNIVAFSINMFEYCKILSDLEKY